MIKTHVVLLTGNAGSGKTEVCNHLKKTIENAVVLKFAGTLKDMLRTFYRSMGVSPEDIERRLEGDLKEEEDLELGLQAPRHLMQTLGTEWGRRCLDENIWARTTCLRALSEVRDSVTPVGIVIIDDLRFHSELDFATKFFEKVSEVNLVSIRIERDGAKTSIMNHQSETEVSSLLVDHEIENNGTLRELFNTVDKVIEHEETISNS